MFREDSLSGSDEIIFYFKDYKTIPIPRKLSHFAAYDGLKVWDFFFQKKTEIKAGNNPGRNNEIYKLKDFGCGF